VRLALHDAHQRLAGREALQDLLADGLLAHLRDEVAHHRQRDVGLEQREPDLAQHLLGVRLGQAGLAAQRLDDAREALRQVFQHADRLR
jgi:hypothetical protein